MRKITYDLFIQFITDLICEHKKNITYSYNSEDNFIFYLFISNNILKCK